MPLEGEVRGLEVNRARRQLEEENRQLKQIVAEQTLDIQALLSGCSAE